MSVIPHQLHLRPNQIAKMVKGLPVQIGHGQMGSAAGEHVIMLHPMNAKKIMGAYSKGKGVRISLHPEEVQHTVMHGRGFGKFMKKVGKVVKGVLTSPEMKELGKQVTAMGADAVGTMVSQYSGDPAAGMALSASLKKASSAAIDHGSYKKGIQSVKKDAIDAGEKASLKLIDKYIEDPDLKSAAKDALLGAERQAEHQYDPTKGYGLYAGGLGLKKGSPEMAAKMAHLRAMRGQGVGKKIVRGLKSAGKHTASALIHHVLPTTLGVAGEMLGGPAGAIALGSLGGVAAEQIGKKTGYGMPRPRGRPRKEMLGMGATMSSLYKKALRRNKDTFGVTLSNTTGDNEPISKFSVDPRVRPSSDEMTLSPYQNVTSPAMNPFVPKFYTQQGGTSCGYGGRGLY